LFLNQTRLKTHLYLFNTHSIRAHVAKQRISAHFNRQWDLKWARYRSHMFYHFTLYFLFQWCMISPLTRIKN